MRRISLFSVVNLSKYETHVLPYTSNPISATNFYISILLKCRNTAEYGIGTAGILHFGIVLVGIVPVGIGTASPTGRLDRHQVV